MSNPKRTSRRPVAPNLLVITATLLFTALPVAADETTVLKPTITSEDGSAEFRLRGRILLDGAVHIEDGASMQNGFRFRRVRLGFQGKVNNDWAYKFEYDFAENDVTAKDVWIGYTGFPVNIRWGHFKVPFSLEELSSSNSIPFMERSLANLFAPGRAISLGMDTSGDHFTLAALTFGREAGASVAGDQAMGAALRVTLNPLAPTAVRVLHIGASGNWRRTDNENTWRWSQRPESRVDGARFVDTRVILGDNTAQDIQATRAVTLVGGELGWIEGSFSVQGEYIASALDRRDETDLAFTAYYGQASYVLGGTYGYENGVMQGVSIDASAPGALEFAVRYSHVDLNDGPITGGNMSSLMLATNWYVNPNIRFLVNYALIQTDDEGPRTDDPVILQARAQFAF